MKQKTTRHAATMAALLLTATGCGSTPKTAPTAANTPTPTAAASATTAAPSPTTNPSPTPDPYAHHRFGQVAQVRDGAANATVYGYKQPVAKNAPKPDDQPGYVWGAADVKVCAGKTYPDGILVTNTPWTLVYDDDTQIEASSIGYNQFPQPGYPFGEKTIAPGRCLRGWITFPVPGGKRPVAVEYAPEGESIAPRWAVK